MRPLKARYQFLFFDLDHTLWDYTTNSVETLKELYQKYRLQEAGSFCPDTFCQTFDVINRGLWEQNETGRLGRDELRRQRFVRVLQELGVDVEREAIASGLDQDYMDLCPAKGGLLPYAQEVLEYLKSRYPMYVLTNGFRDVQDVKLKASQIQHYFSGVFTAEDAGLPKPHVQFFQHVLQQTGARPQDCLMIGDNLKADIIGAAAAGIDSIYYNPNRRTYHVPVQQEINCLSELKKLL